MKYLLHGSDSSRLLCCDQRSSAWCSCWSQHLIVVVVALTDDRHHSAEHQEPTGSHPGGLGGRKYPCQRDAWPAGPAWVRQEGRLQVGPSRSQHKSRPYRRVFAWQRLQRFCLLRTVMSVFPPGDFPPVRSVYSGKPSFKSINLPNWMLWGSNRDKTTDFKELKVYKQMV